MRAPLAQHCCHPRGHCSCTIVRLLLRRYFYYYNPRFFSVTSTAAHESEVLQLGDEASWKWQLVGCTRERSMVPMYLRVP